MQEEEISTFGVDWEQTAEREEGAGDIECPETRSPLEYSGFEDLKLAISPLASSAHFGIDLYEQRFCVM